MHTNGIMFGDKSNNALDDHSIKKIGPITILACPKESFKHSPVVSFIETSLKQNSTIPNLTDGIEHLCFLFHP